MSIYPFIPEYTYIYTNNYIGIDHNSKSFFVAFAFLPDQTEQSYKWALTQTQELYSLLNIPELAPGAISTDCDQALRNAIFDVFPDIATLLCIWHANKNIQQHCKHKFNTIEAYNEFFQAWQHIIQSPNPIEYNSRLLQFSATYPGPESKCVEYVKKTWLKEGRKQALVQAWTNKYTHFGITVTSRLVLIPLL
jgi:MULE transposase domain